MILTSTCYFRRGCVVGKTLTLLLLLLSQIIITTTTTLAIKSTYPLGQGACTGGGDDDPLLEIDRQTIITCQKTCIKNKDCLTFSYNGKTKRCLLFDRFNSCLDRDSADGFATYRLASRRLFSITLSPGPEFSWYRLNFGAKLGGLQSGMCVMPFHMGDDGMYQYDGHEIGRVQNAEILEPECGGLCAKDPNCQAFTYGVLIPGLLIKCVMFDSKCVGLNRNTNYGEDLLNSAIRIK
jgi:hypothetical protein